MEQIKEKLIENSVKNDIQNLLDNQKVILYNQIEKINNSISAIEACQEIDAAGKNPPWTFLSRFLQSLGNVDLSIKAYGNLEKRISPVI